MVRGGHKTVLKDHRLGRLRTIVLKSGIFDRYSLEVGVFGLEMGGRFSSGSSLLLVVIKIMRARELTQWVKVLAG